MSPITVIPLETVENIPLPNGSWSKMVITDTTTNGANVASLGYSVFTPGTTLSLVKHETEEFAYVLTGHGELHLQNQDPIPFNTGDGIHIPANIWHAVANTSNQDIVMVFGFPHPNYPPTERS